MFSSNPTICALLLAPVVCFFTCPQGAGQNSSHLVIPQQKGPNPWTHLKFHNEPKNFQFAIVSDLTGRERPGIFADAVRKLNLLQPEFVMSIGDVIEGHTNDPEQLDQHWEIFRRAVSPLEMPFFLVAGNHDYYYRTIQNFDKKREVYDMAAKWHEHWGPSYYHFVYRNVLFLSVNSCLPGPDQNDRQFEYFAGVLDRYRDVRWIFVFFHYPLWRGTDNIWKRMEPLFEDRRYTVFAGNEHHYVKYQRDDRDYVLLATTGGMSRMRGPRYGEFDHLVWVTMRDDGPRMINLMLDGLYDMNVKTVESERLTTNLLASAPISSPVIFHESRSFQKVSTRLELKNENHRPLKISINTQRHKHLRSKPAVFEIIVPPKSTAPMELQLHVDRPVPTYDLRPLVLEWKAVYELPDQPDVEVKGKHRIVIDLQKQRPRPAELVISDEFTGPVLHPNWNLLEAGGAFNGRGQFALSDNPSAAVPNEAQYTDGRGRYTLNALWHLPLAGIFRDIPPGTFEAELKISNIQWGSGDHEVIRWEFWDDPHRPYHYGPFFRRAAIVKAYRDVNNSVLEVGKFSNDKYRTVGRLDIADQPNTLSLRANWRESMRTWQFTWGANEAEPTAEIPGAQFEVDTLPSPDGKRNLIFVEQAKEKSGFSVDLDDYRIAY